MEIGEVYSDKISKSKWTVIEIDKKKSIIKSVSGKRKRTTEYNYFLRNHKKVE